MNALILLVEEAKKFLGAHEEGGDNCGPQVELFQKAVDGKAERESWCMAFVQFCVKEVQKQVGYESRLVNSEHCLTVWNGTPKDLRSDKPLPGAIAIWQHGSTTQGHTGIVTTLVADTFWTIEGNTGPGSGIVREGDGVYEKHRTLEGAGDMKLLGFILPFPPKG